MIFSSTLPHLLYIKPVLNTAKCTLGLISVYDSENFNQALTSQVPMMPHIKNKVSPEATQVGESVNCELVWVFLPILLFLFFHKRPVLSGRTRKTAYVFSYPRLLWPIYTVRVFLCRTEL